jgi:broad specificity polyphosphatase/5'/3'-nucleotidase SurE
MASIDIIRAATVSVATETVQEGSAAIAESTVSMSSDVEQLMRDSAERSRDWLDSGEEDPSFF